MFSSVRISGYLLLAVGIMFPAWSFGQQLLVDNPSACDLIGPDDGGQIMRVISADNLVLVDDEIIGHEWHCSFEPAIDLSKDDLNTQTRIGYCEEPGPWITPEVFTFLIQKTTNSNGNVTVFQQDNPEGSDFYFCE